MLTKTRAQSLRAIKHRAEEMDENQSQARPMGPGETAVTSLLVMGNDYQTLRDAYLHLHEDGAYEHVVGLLTNIAACAVRTLDVLVPVEDAGSDANDASVGESVLQKQPEVEPGDLVHVVGETECYEIVELTPIAGASTIVTLRSTEDESPPFDVTADQITFAKPSSGNPPGLAWFQRLQARLGNAGALAEAKKRGERVTGRPFRGMDGLANLAEALDSLSKGQPGDVGAIISQLEEASRRAAA